MQDMSTMSPIDASDPYCPYNSSAIFLIIYDCLELRLPATPGRLAMGAAVGCVRRLDSANLLSRNNNRNVAFHKRAGPGRRP